MFILFFLNSHSGGVESKLGPLGTSATNWPIVLAPGNCEDEEFGGMKIGRGNRSTRRKPAPASHYPPQIPLDQTRARTRAAAVGSQRLTAWAMARPRRTFIHSTFSFKFIYIFFLLPRLYSFVSNNARVVPVLRTFPSPLFSLTPVYAQITYKTNHA
jgi:hypothetical protein